MSLAEKITTNLRNSGLVLAQKGKGKVDAFADTAVDTVKSTWGLVSNPKAAFDNLATAITHPKETVEAISKSAKETVEKDYIQGNAYSRSYVEGKVLFGVGATIVGTKGLGSLAKVGKVPDVPNIKASKLEKTPVVKNETQVDGVKGKLKHPVLDNPRVGSALKDDFYHNFNDIIDNYTVDAQRFDLPNKKGHMDSLYQIEGSMVKYETKYVKVKNNAPEMLQTKETIDGVFEWVVNPKTNTVTHRTFIPGGEVTGKINQWGK
ncbi:hypothetical protein R6U77_19815 [Lysinibacillus louembei]|uniref:Pre-toxin TG domain-containing protein n=1 Tax=Lysinibacillus louembei TaxID=1470088 RepID=A0ABZ0RVC8_9BACI|nr:hypothetical protein [Lysinibacillus louembei]WPK12105.1 hypothetical protein R6U77_19815 [Lysinibacillus louembei]